MVAVRPAPVEGLRVGVETRKRSMNLIAVQVGLCATKQETAHVVGRGVAIRLVEKEMNRGMLGGKVGETIHRAERAMALDARVTAYLKEARRETTWCDSGKGLSWYRRNVALVRGWQRTWGRCPERRVVHTRT